MKKILLFTSFVWLLGTIAYGQASVLNDIQQQIDTAFYRSVKSGRLSDLTALERSLSADTNPLSVYWQAYAKYYEAAYYLTKNDKEISEKVINEGISLLNDKRDKTSDDYALLAIMQTFSMQFMTNAIKMKFRSNTILKNIDRAIQDDDSNVRAYLAGGVTDYYTPAEYGGRKKVEGYLKRAVSLNSRRVAGAEQPTWGKELAYQLLINFYLDKKEDDKAEHYMEEALRLYPSDYGLNQLQREIEQSYGLLREIMR